VQQGIRGESVWKDLNGQRYLSNDEFIHAIRERLEVDERFTHQEIPRAHRRALAKSLAYYCEEFEDALLFGVWPPAGMSFDIVNKLGMDIAEACASPNVREQFHKLTGEPTSMGSAEFARLVRAEFDAVAKIAKAAGIKMQLRLRSVENRLAPALPYQTVQAVFPKNQGGRRRTKSVFINQPRFWRAAQHPKIF
jgi:hypothetical protein